MKLLDERICVLFKCHWQHTLVFWSVFFSFGLCIAFLGPTILDLRCQTQSTLQQITWVFFSQQLFLLVGSSVEGLFKKTLLCSLSALFCCTFVISLVFAVIPLCNHVVLLSIAMAIAGLSMGVIDTIANRQLVKLYQKDSATFLQALHFFIGLGALVTPLVADPFLAEDSCVLGVNLTANSSSSSTSDLGHLRSSMAGQGAALPNISQYPLHTEGRVITRVSYAFWIMAIINLPVPAAVLTLMYRERMLPCSSKSQHLLDKDSKTSRSPSGESESHNVDTEEGHGSLFCCCNTANIQGHPATFFVIHALGGAILFITDGIIGSYAGFVYTYAVSPPLLMGHKTAGCLDSIFWAAITLGRLAFIYLSSKYTSSRLLTISLVGVILVQCLLLIFYTSSVFLFVGTCVLGLCISSVFPSMLAFTEDILDYKDISKSRCEVPVQPIRESFPQTLQGGARRSFHSNWYKSHPCIFMLTLVQLSPEIFMGCATTVLVTCASTGEMALQLIVGSVINSQGSYSFLLCCTGASFIAFCLFLLFLYIHHIHRNFQKDWSKYTEMEEKPKPGGS